MAATPTIAICIIGLSGVGKSTITNALTGTNYASHNTNKIVEYALGNFKEFTNPDTLDCDNMKNDVILPFPKDFKLSKKCIYSIYDLPSVTEIDNKIKVGSRSIKFLKNDIDIVIVVFDIFTFEQHIEKNFELLEHVKENLKSGKLFIIFNKCDSLVMTNEKITFSDSKIFIKYKMYLDMLENKGYCHVFPLFGRGSAFISAGINDIFDNPFRTELYKAQTFYINPQFELIKYGFYNLIENINEYVNNRMNETNDIHAPSKLSNDIKSDTFNTTSYTLTSIANKLFENIISTLTPNENCKNDQSIATNENATITQNDQSTTTNENAIIPVKNTIILEKNGIISVNGFKLNATKKLE